MQALVNVIATGLTYYFRTTLPKVTRKFNTKLCLLAASQSLSGITTIRFAHTNTIYNACINAPQAY